MISLPEKTKYNTGTSALSPMRAESAHSLVLSSNSYNFSRTSNFRAIFPLEILSLVERTTSFINASSCSSVSTDNSPKAIHELKKLSGLTWQQLARLFNVAPRSLHFWASGKPMSRLNEEYLHRLLGVMRYVNRGSAGGNRSALLSHNNNGECLLDLLVVGKLEEVKRILGRGTSTSKSELLPLSPEAMASRLPQRSKNLVDALPPPPHQHIGRSRAARSVRSRRVE
jgi:DNA-binding transcriptional regulator YiaG